MNSPSSIIPLLLTLPLSHESFQSLLTSHKPILKPSSLPQQQLNKLITRINTSLLSRDSDADRRSALLLAQEMISQDSEGYILLTWGKGWVSNCLASLASSTGQSGVEGIDAVLILLENMILESKGYPSFEREVVQPILGKVGVGIGRLVERCIGEREWGILLQALKTLLVLINHSPPPFRPLSPTLRPHLYHLILSSEASSIPDEIRRKASDVVAALHQTLGKAQAPAGWGSEMKEALGGIGFGISGIVSEAWEEETVRATPPPPPSALPPLPLDPSSRLPISLDYLEGYTEIVLSLLRFPTARPVPIPVAQIVTAGLRCLSLTLDTPTVSYITPQHHAALLASLPRIWSAGLLLLCCVALACEDHLFPHLSLIFDHTVWLLERLPTSMVKCRVQFLDFHRILLNIYPSSLLPVEYPTRLLKLCLSALSPLLESRSPSPTNGIGNNTGGGGKRGKKRARGIEDGLVASLEGREWKGGISKGEVEVVVQALKLTPLLNSTPLLAPSLLTFSIRLHLALLLSVASDESVGIRPYADQIKESVENVLEDAVMMTEGEQGTSKGWKSVVISVLRPRGERLALLLHPSLPPMNRPQPPLSALHFFTTETEEERRLRQDLGFGSLSDMNNPKDEDEEMMDTVPTISTVKTAVHPASIPAVTSSSAHIVIAQETIPTEEFSPIMLDATPQPSTNLSNPHSHAVPIPLPGPIAQPTETIDYTNLTKDHLGPIGMLQSDVVGPVKGKEPMMVKDSGVAGVEEDDDEMLELDSGSDDDEEDAEDDESEDNNDE